MNFPFSLPTNSHCSSAHSIARFPGKRHVHLIGCNQEQPALLNGTISFLIIPWSRPSPSCIAPTATTHFYFFTSLHTFASRNCFSSLLLSALHYLLYCFLPVATFFCNRLSASPQTSIPADSTPEFRATKSFLGSHGVSASAYTNWANISQVARCHRRLFPMAY